MIINSFFSNGGTPATGLTPVVRIWEVSASSHTLVVNNDNMVEVGDGFYKYDFATYNSTKNYLVRADGGISLQNVDRYVYAATEELNVDDASVAEIAAGVWDESAIAHVVAGTTGEMLSQIKADTTNINVSLVTINSLINTVLKYERNRTRIDTTARTLTIYDDDCVTPLTVFNLKDSTGAASVTEVCERAPTTCP